MTAPCGGVAGTPVTRTSTAVQLAAVYSSHHICAGPKQDACMCILQPETLLSSTAPSPLTPAHLYHPLAT